MRELTVVFDTSSTQDNDQVDELPAGTTLLRGQYVIEQYMVQGGFGITYLARDSLDRQYVIKECFPGALCCRVDGKLQPQSPDLADKYQSILRHFLREARRVAKLDHPNIVHVHQVFEENNTAYMAMEVVPGEDLLAIMDTNPDRLTGDILSQMLCDALTAISYIHELGILHRDISPDNFLLDPDNHLTLIDFGAARERAGKEHRALSNLLAVKDGYSPHEFYLTDVPQGASSDLYSLGATFYHLITGEAPPNSQDRVAALAAHQADPYVPLASGGWDLDFNILQTIDRALEVLSRDRIASAAEWLSMLDIPPPPVVEEEIEEPSSEVELTRVISRLVEDTNRQVQQGMPGDAALQAERKKKRKRARLLDQELEDGPKELVDIFGAPIENLDFWLRENGEQPNTAPKQMQSKSIKPRVQEEEATDAVQDDAQPEGTKASGGSGLVKLFTSCLPIRRSSNWSPIQN